MAWKRKMKTTKDEIKGFFSELGQFIAHYYKDLLEGIRGMKMTSFIEKLFSVLLISVAFAFFCYLREGTGDLYMSVFIPSFFANAFLVLFSSANKSSNVYSILTVLLITMGVALQIFMLPPDGENVLKTVYKYVVFVFIGIVLSMIVVPVLSFITSYDADTRILRAFIIIGTVLLYLVLLVFGKEVNGAKSWLYIGSNSIQLTEITKVFAGVYFVLCLTDKKMSEKAQSTRTFIALLIHAAFLVLVNEFGTLLMIGIVYFFLKLLFFKNNKLLLKEVVSLVVIIAVLLSVFYGFYKMVPVKEAQQTTVEETVQEGDASASAESDNTESEDAAPSNKLVDEALGRLQTIFPKITHRFSVFLGIGELTADDTYQIDSAKKALYYAELFGREKGSFGFVPEIKSDFVFVYLVVRLGIVGAMVVLITLVTLFAETFICAAKSKNPRESALAICFICFIVIQSLICMCSNLGLFPVVGLPFAFLSDGGSATCVNLIMSFFIIYFMRKKRVLPSVNEVN